MNKDYPRIFLIGCSSKIFVGVAKALKQKGADILYWSLNRDVKATEQISKTEFPNTVFHSVFDALKGVPASGVDDTRFEPVGDQLLSKLYECESETLAMMDRIDYGDVPYARKKHFYAKYVAYWNGVLKQFKPDAIFMPTFPHLVYDFVLYHLAKLHNIPVIMFEHASMPDRLLFQNSIKEGSGILLEELKENKRDAQMEDLPKDLKEYYLKMSNPKETYLFYNPLHLRRSNERSFIPYKPNFKSQFKKIIKGNIFGIFKSAWRYFKRTKKFYTSSTSLSSFDQNFTGFLRVKKMSQWQKTKKQFQIEYEALQTKPDLNKKFVLFTLSSQPERSTSPMGGIFCDQILVIDMLSKAVPDDWVIYVKEHPAQWSRGGAHYHQGRYIGYYKEITKHKNVFLTPIAVSTDKMILKSQAVASIAGTTGWQSLFKLKPALIFGYPVYRYCHGVLLVRNFKECKEAIGQVIAGFKPNKQKVLNFFVALSKVSINAYFDERGRKKSELSANDSINNLSNTIWQELTN